MSTFFNLLNDINNVINEAVLNGMISLQEPLVVYWLVPLAIIGIASNWEMYFASESWNWGNLFIKIIHIGFFAFLIRNWKMFIMIVKQTGEQLGIAAGGDTGILKPSDILNTGVQKVYDAMGILISGLSWNLQALTNLLGVIILLFALYAFLKIACTLFFTYAEFMIVGGLSMVLLPFAMTKWTKGIADKTWGILLTGAVKIMVCVFMVSLTANFIEDSFTSMDIKNPSVAEILLNTISIGFLSYLIGKSVEYAGAMTNGLTVSTPNMVGVAAGQVMRAPGYARTAGRIAKGGAVAGGIAGRAGMAGAKKAGAWWLKYGGGVPL